MKKLSALLLSLLLLLTACGAPATPGDAVTLPTPNDDILVEEGLRAEDLSEFCRLWFDLAETSGAADKNSKLPLASRADEGSCDYLAVRLPDGTYTDLIQEGKLADEGVTLADFSGGRAKQEGSYGQLAWNGELYHAFTVSAADCTLPNLTAPDGGILRLNIFGADVRCGALHMGSNAEEKGTLLVESGDLTVDGEFWLQNAALTVTGGELTLAGDASIDRGEVRISGGTVTFGHGLWLGEGDIVITGGTVIVPGGEAGLTAENGKVTISGGAVREP